MLLRFQKAAVLENYETGNQAFSKRLRFLTIRERIAEIGPIPVIAGREYSALYMEAILDPGMTSAIHTHSGPEAWLTVAGETCLETPEGKFVGRPGGRAVIVPAGMPMLLTATGAEQRRALTLILHESSERPTTVVHDWMPKDLCKK